MRRALFISKPHRRSRAFGWSVVTYQSPNQLGLITLSGIVVDPRPFRDWRGEPQATGVAPRRAVGGLNPITAPRAAGGGKRGPTPPARAAEPPAGTAGPPGPLDLTP